MAYREWLRSRHIFFFYFFPSIFFSISILNYSIYADDQNWQRLNIDMPNASAVCVDKDNSALIYAGSRQALFKTTDQGKTWQLAGGGTLTEINFILIDPKEKNTVYAATGNGLFKSQDAGDNWQKVFSGKDVYEKSVLGIVLCSGAPKTVFIATKGGVFFSPANRIVWQKVAGQLNDASVSAIAADPVNPDTLYVVTNKGLFKGKDRLSYCQRLYTGANAESEDASFDIDSEEEEGALSEFFLRHIAVDPKDVNKLYLASKQGVILSTDKGKSWQRQSLYGLLNERLNFLLFFGGRFFLASAGGVSECNGTECREIFKGADFKNCRQLALDAQNNLYAATDKGLYRAVLAGQADKHVQAIVNADKKANGADVKEVARKYSEEYPAKLSPPKEKIEKPALEAAAVENKYVPKDYFKSEPQILDVQKAAIRYAEVYPEKIIAWRWEARAKAFLPELTLDYDKTVSSTVAKDYERFYVGPKDWSVGFKWNIADLIFSTDQTSIDVRSRLMVQLRDDILDEVNRTYFERKRLKAELVTMENVPPKVRFEKELRIEELTAALDGLTGGYMTRMLNKPQE